MLICSLNYWCVKVEPDRRVDGLGSLLKFYEATIDAGQRRIRDAVEAGRVKWETIHVGEQGGEV